MVAVAHLPVSAPHRTIVVRTTPVAGPRPAPVAAATYRRRRAVALALACVALVALMVAAQGAMGPPAAGPMVDRQAVPGAGGGAVHVVRAGDTFWGIARALRPGEDPRPLVARLVAAHGSSVLVPGDRIVVPPGS